MRNRFLLKVWSCILFLLILIVTVSTVAEDVPIESYGRLPALENVAISPSGSYIALVKTVNEERILYLLSLKGDEPKIACRIGKAKLRDIVWADDEHILMEVSTTSGPPLEFTGSKGEWYMLLAYDVRKENIYNLLTFDKSFKEFILNNIIGTPSIRHINGETIVFVEGLYVKSHTLPALFKANLTTGHLEIVSHGTIHSNGWLVDEKGEIMGSQTYNSRTKQWNIYIRKDGELTSVATGEAEIEYPGISGFSPTGDEIWVRKIGGDGDGDPVWNPIPFESGIMGEQLQEMQGFRGRVLDPYSDRIIGGVPFANDADIVFFDQQRQKIWESIKMKFPGEHVMIASFSRDFQKFILLIDGTVSGYAYFYMDLASFSSTRIGDVYEGLTSISEVRPVEYTAADGMKIPGYLTLPMKREAKNLPLVVLPHGGPASHDTNLFDWWSQALASQGYAVLQPNFRGSSLNWKFMSAGFGEWGRKMQTDLSDGVRYLVKEGVVDANRVCIVGASYGGYAALAGATLDAGVYRCAISLAGPSDLKSFLKSTVKKGSPSSAQTRRYWDRYFGASNPKDPILKAISPLGYAEKVSIPIMLIHGRDDTVVPYDQSEKMAEALKDANKTVEFVTLKNEDHWLSRSETRLQMLDETIRFLKKYNPPY
ncbi:MAG: S9 family peptidase [Deltaproteobacteria bacterium]|nr:S9 family peptidase [Deltaproteobacteria bacterium]